MGTETRIHVRVSPGQKKKWKEYVQETDRYRSLADLVRMAVENEIEGEEPAEQTSPGLESDLDELQAAVESIKGDVSWLKEQQKEEIDMSNISQDVFDALEPLPQPQDGVPDDMDAQLFAARMVIHPDQETTKPQRVKDIAERVDASPSDVEDAISHLKEQYLPVVEVEIDGQQHFFKEE